MSKVTLAQVTLTQVILTQISMTPVRIYTRDYSYPKDQKDPIDTRTLVTLMTSLI